MQIKRFFAKDSSKALAQVRDALGPDALIITNRKVDDGVEVIASAHYDEADIENFKQQQSPCEGASGAIASAEATASENRFSQALARAGARRDEAPAPQPAATASPDSASTGAVSGEGAAASQGTTTMAAMREEIQALRAVLDTQLGALKIGQWNSESAVRSELFDKLSAIGLGAGMISELLAQTEPDESLASASRRVLLALKNALKIAPEDILETPGVAVLLGPTGAGKTTTLVKLAMRLMQTHDPRDVVLVCADQARIGAFEQLQTFGKLLGVAVLRTRDEQSLGALIEQLGSDKYILVDSAGLTQRALREPARMTLLGYRGVCRVRHYLTLPATLQRAALARLLGVFAKLPITATILTKLDEAAQLGDLLSELHRHQQSLVYYSDGQRLGEDLHRADAGALVARAMRLSKAPGEQHDNELMRGVMQARARERHQRLQGEQASAQWPPDSWPNSA